MNQQKSAVIGCPLFNKQSRSWGVESGARIWMAEECVDVPTRVRATATNCGARDKTNGRSRLA
jgi:hypothetical protein